MRIRWAGWGESAFARARGEGRPVLLSLTASWCHACHRMDEETWDDPGIAAAVERAAVPVRVDADERPDLYARYHAGGLPTVALLTADGDFVRGGTFLSPPQLLGFLESGLADFASGRRPGLRPAAPPSAPAGSLLEEAVVRLLRRADPEHGGFGAAPKLPEPEALTLLLRRWRAQGDAALERILRLTLDAIALHLHDEGDGGFFRYAAAADWTGPHTEKVAADQARLARLFLEAACALGEPRHLLTARHALGHARRRLADEAGRVFASVAADPGYYAGAHGGGREDLPAVDRRRFADAGAAMVSAGLLALAVGGEDPGFQPEFRAAAKSGCVPHRLDAPGGPSGLLMDQALALGATLDEYRMTGDAGLLAWARKAADWSLEHLWDEGAGAFCAAPEPAEGALRLPPIHPLLGNGEMALALAALADHAAEPRYRERAERALSALGGLAARSPAGAALALAAQYLEDKPAEADLAGDPGDPRARALARTVVAALGPLTIVRWTAGAGASVTICVGNLCLPPIEAPSDLLQSLVDLGLASRGILAV